MEAEYDRTAGRGFIVEAHRIGNLSDQVEVTPMLHGLITSHSCRGRAVNTMRQFRFKFMYVF
jgi:hypothetical protein